MAGVCRSHPRRPSSWSRSAAFRRRPLGRRIARRPHVAGARDALLFPRAGAAQPRPFRRLCHRLARGWHLIRRRGYCAGRPDLQHAGALACSHSALGTLRARLGFAARSVPADIDPAAGAGVDHVGVDGSSQRLRRGDYLPGSIARCGGRCLPHWIPAWPPARRLLNLLYRGSPAFADHRIHPRPGMERRGIRKAAAGLPASRLSPFGASSGAAGDCGRLVFRSQELGPCSGGWRSGLGPSLGSDHGGGKGCWAHMVPQRTQPDGSRSSRRYGCLPGLVGHPHPRQTTGQLWDGSLPSP